MNILFIKLFLKDLWFLRYREYLFGTVRIRLLSLIIIDIIFNIPDLV